MQQRYKMQYVQQSALGKKMKYLAFRYQGPATSFNLCQSFLLTTLLFSFPLFQPLAYLRVEFPTILKLMKNNTVVRKKYLQMLSNKNILNRIKKCDFIFRCNSIRFSSTGVDHFTILSRIIVIQYMQQERYYNVQQLCKDI